MRHLAPILGFVLLLGLPSDSLAWGSDGHRIVGEIAYQRLAEDPRRAVLRILPNRGRYRTLYESATWADTYARGRSQFAYLNPQHYINADPQADTVDVEARCGDRGCVVSAILENACILADEAVTGADKVVPLHLLNHFVGDIHQPLHVAHPDGRGGNRTEPRFLGVRMALHKVWDTALIEYHLQQYADWEDDAWVDDEWEAEFDEVAPWDLYASALSSTLPAEAQTWATQLLPGTWANESLALARDHTYFVTSSTRLGDVYYEQVMPIVEKRLQQGGVRLAALLNRIFSDGDLPFECP